MRLALSAVLLMAFVSGTRAHQAASGWDYSPSCCSNLDCREVSSDAIKESPNGYVIKTTHEVLGYNDPRLRESPDGEYHWCSVGGLPDSRTVCLYRPMPAY